MGVVLDVALVSLIAPRAVLGSRLPDVKGGGERAARTVPGDAGRPAPQLPLCQAAEPENVQASARPCAGLQQSARCHPTPLPTVLPVPAPLVSRS